MWQISHQFVLHILQSAGAEWIGGKKVRGERKISHLSDGPNPILPFLAKIKEMRGLIPTLPPGADLHKSAREAVRASAFFKVAIRPAAR